jgi:hypothetical protein
MRMYRHKHGRFPNLLRPRLFTEKVQVAKLRWRSPLLPLFTDKVAVKDFIAAHVGADLVTPNLYSGDWLPPRPARNWPAPYVIKLNNSSGTNIFVRTPADIDWGAIEDQLQAARGRVYGKRMGEWPYGQLKPQVLVEPFIGADQPPTDVKLYTFGGRVRLFSLTGLRFPTPHYAVYDRDWRRLPLKLAQGPSLPSCEPPRDIDRMVAVAEEIGRRVPFCRVDFYDLDGKARFGEITLFPSSGLAPLDPPEYDRLLGDLFPRGQPAWRW